MANKKFSILNHVLVPRHEKLSPEEAFKVLKELGVKPEQLPIIKYDDPVAKELGLRPGDIVKIVRKSENAEEVVTYRYVVGGF